jgi:hypothetical protein
MSVVGMMTITHAALIVAALGGARGEIVRAAILVAAGYGMDRVCAGWLRRDLGRPAGWLNISLRHGARDYLRRATGS